ncbi:C-type mannose receptor 2-like [Branchiostoma floridae]|uniref:C-type mannose receptor 2-like n=1 Tax=Branchiostoma floridae TaxID=7739 RepID=A0A9J7KWX8_BRAFL|nr:C-type mannose receptor 2-like [Branchiostoma floridae]
MDVERQWAFADGQSLDSSVYSSWHPSQPNNHANEDCGAISDSGHWHDSTCNSPTRRFICQLQPGCPSAGYVSFSGNCFKFFAEMMTYFDAKQTCADDGALLAMPKDSATNSFITSLVPPGGRIWIGMTDIKVDRQWVFANGQSLESSVYSNWGTDEPNNHANEDCGALSDSGHWYASTCNTQIRRFICQFQPGCPTPSYISFSGNCFKLFAETKTFFDARQTCAEDGALLAMPKDSATNSFITSLIPTGGGRWVGLSDMEVEGQWVFADGQSLESSVYSSWYPDQPNDYGGLDCVNLFASGRWEDDSCDANKTFICQFQTACPIAGYVNVKGICYQFFAQKKTYGQAEETCAAGGALLAMPKDSTTNSFITSLVPPGERLWIGLTDMEVEKQWAFADGQSLESSGYSSWHPTCPIPDYVSFKGTCYKDFTERVTYSQAEQACAADGGMLAMPKDSATNSFIASLKHGGRWLGLTAGDQNGQY